MSSTYSTNLAIELMGTGDQAGNWGATTNVNLGTLIEQAISGYVSQSVATGTDTTITIPNGATGVARNMFIQLTGTGGASTNLIVPTNRKLYFIYNSTAGQVTVKVSGQTGVSVPAGAKVVLVSNGTDVVDATNYMSSLTVGGNETIGGTLGVTGTTTLTGAAVLNGAVSGTGIAAYLASPPAIGGTAAAAGSFTTVTASGAMTGATANDSLGNVRNIAQQTKASPYTLVATDNGQCIITNSGVTVPNSVFAAGNVVTIYNNSGSTITITQGSGLTLQFAGQASSTTGNRSLSLYGITTVLFLSASSAVITGAGLY
jgi:hypothetical protein